MAQLYALKPDKQILMKHQEAQSQRPPHLFYEQRGQNKSVSSLSTLSCKYGNIEVLRNG